jgi:hypothetical protein
MVSVFDHVSCGRSLQSRPAPAAVRDIEDFGGARDSQRVARVTKVVRGSKRPADDEPEKADQTPEDYTKTWREAIGEAPDRKEDYQGMRNVW